jgi:dienelactone hydrolase
MEWKPAAAAASGQAAAHEFLLDVDGRVVTGVLFSPVGAAPGARLPLVLFQHGGSSHKRGADVLDWVDLFVRDRGLCMAAIDGPVHGDRRPNGLSLDDRAATRERFLDLWKTQDEHVATMVADWRAVVAALRQHPRVDGEQLVWVGQSMGTAYGLPLLAHEASIRAAAIGMWGLSYPNSQKLGEAAQQVRCPVLFQQKWDDELFNREGQIALFERLAPQDKRLNVYPGGHTAVQGAQRRDVDLFVMEQLGR